MSSRGTWHYVDDYHRLDCPRIGVKSVLMRHNKVCGSVWLEGGTWRACGQDGTTHGPFATAHVARVWVYSQECPQ